jgi:hypothetical protein
VDPFFSKDLKKGTSGLLLLREIGAVMGIVGAAMYICRRCSGREKSKGAYSYLMTSKWRRVPILVKFGYSVGDSGRRNLHLQTLLR